MSERVESRPRRRRGRGIRPWLILVKFLGLVGFFGGLGALAALGLRCPAPDDQAGWLLLRAAMRAIFWPCVFGGLMVTVGAGIALWLQHPRVFLRMRWFRLKALLLLILLPLLHLRSRRGVQGFYDAIEAGRLEELPERWGGVTRGFLVAFVVMFVVAMIGRYKPRLGQRYGTAGGARPTGAPPAPGTPRSPSPSASARSSPR